MKWVAKTTSPRILDCIIYDEEFTDIADKSISIGYYLEVYEPNATEGGAWDYLQDTLQLAKEHALEQFQVPLDAWKLVE